jgi:hypothetical protein
MRAMMLPEPMELLDLPDKGILTTRILRYEDGEATIKTGAVPDGKVVVVTRIHVPKEDKPLYPHYWDVTSKTLRAQLVPLLPDIIARGARIRVQKHGVAPLARFSLEVMP